MGFPTSPSDGDTYTNALGCTYEYDDTDDKWTIVSQSGVDATSLNADLMNGSANAAYIPCIFIYDTIGAASTVWAYGGDAMGIQNTGGSDMFPIYELPLPTNRGGDKLYIKGFKISVADADANDYVHSTILYGINGATPTTIENNDNGGANFKNIAETNIAYASPHDVSGYDKVVIGGNCSNVTNGELEIAYISLLCYYDGDVTNDVAVSKSDFDAALMIGAANAAYVACTFACAEPRTSITYDNVGYRNTGAVDFLTHFDIPLPSNRGGLKLYGLAWKMYVMRADADDYVDGIHLYGWDFIIGWLNPENDNSNLITAGEHEYVFGAPVDMSGADLWMLYVEHVSTSIQDLYVNGMAIKVYYDV